MYSLNKIIWVLANPLSLGLLMFAVGILLKAACRCAGGVKKQGRVLDRIAAILLCASFIWFWMWGSKAWTCVVGAGLEREFLIECVSGFRMRDATDYPFADAIVDLGGGCGAETNFSSCVSLNAGSDRAYFSALLWKAGKAPIVIPSGNGLDVADKRFIMDLGVPEDAIVVENNARNTEENARFVRDIVLSRQSSVVSNRSAQTAGSGLKVKKPSVLLVTSAWHMKRSLLMFKKYAPELECIPAACDFECSVGYPLSFKDVLPDPGAFECNCRYFHEWLGLFGYKYLRR